MLFNSLAFLFIFYPLVVLATDFVPKKGRNLVLFIASLFFLLFASGSTLRSPTEFLQGFLTIDFWMLVGSILVSYLLGLGIYYQTRPKAKKLLLILGILLSAAPLLIFKIRRNMPLGLSFYTFQIISYLADVYQGKTKPEKSLIAYSVYMGMFLRLLQGPMIRYDQIEDSLHERKILKQKKFQGLQDIIIGLGMKVILSGQIGRLWTNILTIGADSIPTPLAWMGAVAYSLQLYFDFAGYSLMAIGMGRMLGLDLPDNFNYPYIARTMSDFWRRWHMTLGSWFRDYIYIPLGGNRKGTAKTIRNLLIVWLLTGFWHGFGWNFLLWGLMTFGLIVLERYVIGKQLEKWPVLAHIYMALVIPLMWMVFANTDFKVLLTYFGRLFGLNPLSEQPADTLKYLRTYGLWLLGGIVLATPGPGKLYVYIRRKLPIAIVPILLAILWISVYWIVKGQSDPFMYFHF